jgi:hypothetical protein
MRDASRAGAGCRHPDLRSVQSPHLTPQFLAGLRPTSVLIPPRTSTPIKQPIRSEQTTNHLSHLSLGLPQIPFPGDAREIPSEIKIHERRSLATAIAPVINLKNPLHAGVKAQLRT